MEVLNIIIADNQALTRAGIMKVLTEYFNGQVKFEVVSNKDDLLAILQKGNAQSLIIDYELFDFKEIAELSEIKKMAPSMGILVVTDNQTPDDIMRVLNCGINNYILKTCEPAELMDAFNATQGSRKYFSSEILDVLLVRKTVTRQATETIHLTLSETDIVRLIAQGLTTKEIAMQKHLSFHTIITHRKNIFRKLGISNTSELLMYAMRTGIIDSTEYYI
jgi:DNA-binding NarL/FixJ family response regulator